MGRLDGTALCNIGRFDGTASCDMGRFEGTASCDIGRFDGTASCDMGLRGDEEGDQRLRLTDCRLPDPPPSLGVARDDAREDLEAPDLVDDLGAELAAGELPHPQLEPTLTGGGGPLARASAGLVFDRLAGCPCEKSDSSSGCGGRGELGERAAC